MKKLNIVLIIAALGGMRLVQAQLVGIKVIVNTSVNSCVTKRGNVTCSAVVQAKGGMGVVGEVVQKDIPVENATQLGTITVTKEETVTAPKRGEYDVYAFTPSRGNLRDQLVYVAFEMAPAVGTIHGDTKVLNMYARLAIQKATVWYHGSEIVGTKDGVAPQKWAIDSEGTWTTPNPAYEKDPKQPETTEVYLAQADYLKRK